MVTAVCPESPVRRVWTAAHWGAYTASVRDGRVVALQPVAHDPDPSPMGRSLPGALDDACRIRRPMVRAGFLERGPHRPSTGRGGDPFVPVSWDEALDLVAEELDRVRRVHGNDAIFGGSYGWGSAGRFHHARSQIHRFLNQIGGYTSSVNSYSVAAGEVILPHVVGSAARVTLECSSWAVIAEHSRLIVMFGGMPLKNAQVENGGVGRHTTREWLERCRANGVDFVNISPLRDDAADLLGAEWLAPRPNTDTAIMLGLAHTLVANELHDRTFLARYCVGFERFLPYLTGESDGLPKDAEWAARISGVDADVIHSLARRMAATRTLISLSFSLQRGDHGEQPYWMAITLAAMLGQIGLPGGGFGFGYGAMHGIGNPARQFPWGALDEGRNPVRTFIPVARIADLLLRPGETIDYDGRKITFPDIRLVYWAGGNPFHHHQDINRLLHAWQQPETIIVHEPWWSALARHADIVLPVTTALERNDIAACVHRPDGFLLAMQQAIPPVGQARNDYEIFADLAERLGVKDAFTEGRDETAWLRHLYTVSCQRAAQRDLRLPDFETFWARGHIELPPPATPRVLLGEFRADPEACPLTTPSGKIEIFSATIDGFGYDDCPGHPAWLEPCEWLGAPKAERYPLHLMSNQPAARLHSQLDNGIHSRERKVGGREPMAMHPRDAVARGIRDGDVVRLFNDRGACLAGAVVTEAVRPGVVQLATGAWYDPLDPGKIGSLDKHGNPNLLTPDKGTSKLSQGPSANSALVQCERYEGTVPPVTAFAPPP